MRQRYGILQVIDSLAGGGAERQAVELSRYLKNHGLEVTVVVSDRGGVLETQLHESNVPLIHLDHHWRLGVDGVVALSKMVREIRPLVVHTHLLGSDIIGRSAALLAATPVVLSTQHDDYVRPLRYRAFRMMTGRLIDATVACSPSVLAYCRKNLRLPESRLYRIDNGVAVERFASHPVLERDGVTIGVVASLLPHKGHRFLLQALPGVLREQESVRVLLAGDGPEKERLQALADRLGIADHVEFMGFVRDIPAFLNGIDIAVLPSLQEGLPLALLEGMAAGCCTVATDVGSAKEVLDSGRAGVLVPPADPMALAAALKSLASNPEIARELAAQGRSRIAQHYSFDAMARKYMRLYERLTQEDRS